MIPKFPTVRTCVLEPSSDLLSEYQRNVDTNPLPGFTFEWKNQTLEEYTQSRQNGLDRKYHFISVIHSIYYFCNLEEALRSVYDMLAPGGIILIAVVSGTCDFDYQMIQALHLILVLRRGVVATPSPCDFSQTTFLGNRRLPNDYM